MTANHASVDDYLASITDEQTAQDARTLLELMQRVTNQAPQLWNVGTIGFDTYDYKYESGREGVGHVIGFYPRKGKTTLYLMDGTAHHAELLAKLGPHTLTGYCVYIKRLSDIDLRVLEQIVKQSFDYVKSKSANGPVSSILWQAVD